MVMKNDIPKPNDLVTNLSKTSFSWFLVKAKTNFWPEKARTWSSAAAAEETTCPRTCWTWEEELRAGREDIDIAFGPTGDGV